jgi:uncharacterized protein (DUF1778 family)
VDDKPLRIERSVDAQIREAAAAEGVSVGEFAAAAAKAAADRTLADRAQSTVDPAVWERLYELRDRPARSCRRRRLAEALRRHHA